MPYGAPSTVSRVPCTLHRLPDPLTFTEDQLAASDRALDDLKASPAYFDARDRFALSAQVHMGRAS